MNSFSLDLKSFTHWSLNLVDYLLITLIQSLRESLLDLIVLSSHPESASLLCYCLFASFKNLKVVLIGTLLHAVSDCEVPLELMPSNLTNQVVPPYHLDVFVVVAWQVITLLKQL